jgi:hypothetical protein
MVLSSTENRQAVRLQQHVMARSRLARFVVGPPDLGVPRAAVRAIALLLMIGIVAAVLYDVLWGPSGGEASWTTASPAGAYRGELLLDQVKYDPLRRVVTADLSILVTARVANVTIDRAAFRLARTRYDEIDLVSSSTCTVLEEGDATDGPSLMLPFKRFSCGTVTFDHPEGAGERAYPFDRYAVSLIPGGCVNERECLDSRVNLGFDTVIARAAQPALLPTLQNGHTLSLVLARRPFIKHLALVLAIMSAIFFILLTLVGEPKDLFAKSLGFYGTLWALRTLLVPNSVTAFPTYVDYFVLTLFGLVFAVMLHRVSTVEGVPQ